MSNILHCLCFKHFCGIMQDRFGSRDVIALTGIKARQLQRWEERGMVIPERKRHRRLGTTQHLSEVTVLCDSRRKGFSRPVCGKECAFSMGKLGKRAAENRRSGLRIPSVDRWHASFILKAPAWEIVDILKNPNQPILEMSLSEALRQVGPGLPQERRILR